MAKNKIKKTKQPSLILKNLKYFLPTAFKAFPSYLPLNIIKIIFSSIAPLINIIFPKYIIEELMGDKDIKWIVIYVVIVVVGNVVCNFIINILENRLLLINDKLAKHFDTIINYQAMRMDYENSEDPIVCDLMDKANRSMYYYTNGIAEIMNHFTNIIANIITLFGVLIVIITSKTPILIVISIITVLLSSIINKFQNKLNVDFERKNTRRNRRFSYFFFQLIHFNNAKDIRLYHANKMIKDVCIVDNEEMASVYRELSNRAIIIDSFWSLYQNLIERVLFYGVLLYAALVPANSSIGIPEITMLVVAFETFTRSISDIVWSLQRYQRAAQYQKDYIDFMEYPMKKKTGVIIPEKQISKIEFRNVSFKYPNTENYVLENINFIIENQERLSIVGLNGAGKTTLVKLLCRLYDINEGEILINDINIKEYDYEEYLKLFSVVFQDFKIISFTVQENIEIRENNQDKLYDVLKRSGVDEKIQSLPKKEYTFVNKWFDKEGVEFSGGEMQKLAISRALYKDGAMVILDEPTAALDPIAEAEIYYRFNEVIGKKPTIFISHRLSSCKFSDRIMVIDGKRIVEVGSHSELMQIKDGVYHTMFDAQAQYYKK